VLEVCDIRRFKSGAGKNVVVDDKKIDYVRRSEQERTFIQETGHEIVMDDKIVDEIHVRSFNKMN
jgi:hypothetical protein